MAAAHYEPQRPLDQAPRSPPLVALRDAPLGGQAVIEGVMMRGVRTWAVAVRAPSAEQLAGGRRMAGDEPAEGDIQVTSFPLLSVRERHHVLRWPIIRGVVALGESLRLGFRALNISVNTQLPDSEGDISNEAGVALTPENAQRFSRLHPRCGTSFLLIVMIVAVVVFAPLGTPAWYWLLISRVVAIPLVAGLAFEVIKWFGRNRSERWAQILMLPGMKLQLLTTREPDPGQLAVAIAALQAVLAVQPPSDAGEEDRVAMAVVA